MVLRRSTTPTCRSPGSSCCTRTASSNECGGPIESPLLVVDPVARHQYEHLEYKPLVNARAHALGKRRQIVNDRLYEQYHRFLKMLTYHKRTRTTPTCWR